MSGDATSFIDDVRRQRDAAGDALKKIDSDFARRYRNFEKLLKKNKKKMEDFIFDPTDSVLVQDRLAWLNARDTFLASEVICRAWDAGSTPEESEQIVHRLLAASEHDNFVTRMPAFYQRLFNESEAALYAANPDLHFFDGMDDEQVKFPEREYTRRDIWKGAAKTAAAGVMGGVAGGIGGRIINNKLIPPEKLAALDAQGMRPYMDGVNTLVGVAGGVAYERSGKWFYNWLDKDRSISQDALEDVTAELQELHEQFLQHTGRDAENASLYGAWPANDLRIKR